MPFDASCWLSLDPDTLLPTSHFSREYGLDELLKLAGNEFLEEDFNKFADLARASRPVATLSAATAGQTSAESALRQVPRPHAGSPTATSSGPCSRDGDAAWGALVIHRRCGTFSDREAELVDEIGGRCSHMASDGRSCALPSGSDDEVEAVAIILLGADDTIEAVTPAAREADGRARRLDVPNGSSTPLTVCSAAQQARRAGHGTSRRSGRRRAFRGGRVDGSAWRRHSRRWRAGRGRLQRSGAEPRSPTSLPGLMACRPGSARWLP